VQKGLAIVVGYLALPVLSLYMDEDPTKLAEWTAATKKLVNDLLRVFLAPLHVVVGSRQFPVTTLQVSKRLLASLVTHQELNTHATQPTYARRKVFVERAPR
jgi:hypothetical protein